MTRALFLAFVAATASAQSPRDLGPLTELEAALAPSLAGSGPYSVVVPWFSDAHVQFFGPGWNEAAWRNYLRLVVSSGARGFVGLGDYGGIPPYAQSSLDKFVEILHQEIGSGDPTLVAGIGNHEWFDGAGRRPWMEGIYPTVAFSSFTTATENDRPLYHSHTISSAAASVRVVVTDTSGVKAIPPETWILAEQIHSRQLHWLHKALRDARDDGLPAITFDHYPEVKIVGGALVDNLMGGSGSLKLRTILQFDNVTHLASGHQGPAHFYVGGSTMRLPLEYVTEEFGTQSYRVDALGPNHGHLDPLGAWVDDAPPTVVFGPEWFYPVGVEPYGHATISDIPTDVAILTTTGGPPTAGQTLLVECDYAPANAQGVYYLCPAPDTEGTEAVGVVWFVNPAGSVTAGVVADAGGHVSLPIPIGPGAGGVYWFGQFFFSHPVTGELVASDAHRVTVQ